MKYVRIKQLKYLTLIAFTVGFVLNGSSQNPWPSADSEWWFELGPSLFTPSIEHSYVNGDTLIDGIASTIIRSDLYYSFFGQDNFQIQESSEEYVYFNGDTLFWYKDTAFFPLVCFNAQPGDTWFPLPPDDSFGCDYNPVTVESINTVFYNGEPYRQITMSAFDEEISTFYWGGSFDERTFWRDFKYPQYNACGSIVEWLTYDFRCYSDSEVSIQNTDGSCDAPLFVGNLGAKIVSQPLFSPNPSKSSDLLRLSDLGMKYKRVEIYSSSGNFISEKEISEKQLNLSLVNAGLYILCFMNEEGYTIQRMVLID